LVPASANNLASSTASVISSGSGQLRPAAADQFLETQLKPALLERACARASVPLCLRMHEGYDHSYFFISTFIEDHLRWHAQRLGIATAQ
jgi:S-formylglutathione hydrolase FrmB